LLFWYMPRFTQAALGAANLSASTAMAAGVTIAHRMMLMGDPTAFGLPAGQAEAMRMVAEKVDAATEGSMDAVFETGRLMMRSAFGNLSADEIAHGMVAIGVAATKPAARRVKANARRLSQA
jgi:hypothetical protein